MNRITTNAAAHCTLAAGPGVAQDAAGAAHAPGAPCQKVAYLVKLPPAAQSITSISVSAPATPGVEEPHQHIVLWHVRAGGSFAVTLTVPVA